MKIINGRVFDGEGFTNQDVLIRDGRFVSPDDYVDDGQVVDAAGQVVAPGLVDLHFHGCVGRDFCDGTVESIRAIGAYQASQGVTAMCPATMTFPEDVLGRIMDAAAAYEPGPTEAALVGINMEGPYISPSKVGAQNPLYVQGADEGMLSRLQQRSGNLIKLVDIAPEEPGALEFIERTASDVRISLAHTCADYDQAAAAFQAGARHMTHLYNAMPGLHHRNPGPIAAAAERDDVTPEIICDGVHIHPAMVRLAFTLFGPERMILISDTMEAAGLDDGEYSLGGQPVTVRGNRATLHDGTLAGSNTNLALCLGVAVRDMGIPLEHALRAATCNPARALGIQDERGAIAPGRIADCILLDDDASVTKVILRGTPL
ncbi:MAG: N-acetylglucosamine-6-phosphate deacetylase [Coriobacteriia bacterium]|nr:N-acetylglucosamine-6-phosphate deacetylase [Coriobacteriia bacterium]